MLLPGEFVVVRQINKEKGFAEISSQNRKGVFALEFLDIVNQNEIEELQKRIALQQVRSTAKSPQSTSPLPILEKTNFELPERDKKRERRLIFGPKEPTNLDTRTFSGVATPQKNYPIKIEDNSQLTPNRRTRSIFY